MSTPKSTPALVSLADEITAAHESVCGAARSALAHARRAGDLLLAAKAQLSHGDWSRWLGDHCPTIAQRTAQAYVQVARRWPDLEQRLADPQRVADLPVRRALALLAEPKPPKPTEPFHWLLAIGDMKQSVEKTLTTWPKDARGLAPRALRDLATQIEVEEDGAPEVVVHEVVAGTIGEDAIAEAGTHRPGYLQYVQSRKLQDKSNRYIAAIAEAASLAQSSVGVTDIDEHVDVTTVDRQVLIEALANLCEMRRVVQESIADLKDMLEATPAASAEKNPSRIRQARRSPPDPTPDTPDQPWVCLHPSRAFVMGMVKDTGAKAVYPHSSKSDAEVLAELERLTDEEWDARCPHCHGQQAAATPSEVPGV